MRTVVRAATVLVLVATLASVSSTAGRAQPAPEFKLGFKVLAELIPEVVGQPLENEHHAANGDSLQQTTAGLLVWRKVDNWTAFTDGATTWVNGPMGLQQRLNEARFNWERQARVERTEVIDFQPTGVGGPEMEGRCWTDSLASGRADAWRCMAGNQIFDPCFQLQGDDGAVICGASPPGDEPGFRLRLTEPLPARTTPPSDRPWVLELANGVTCGFLTGATTGVGGERANYGCSDGWFILGEPEPGEVWTANEARIEITMDGPALLDSAEVTIKTVWR